MTTFSMTLVAMVVALAIDALFGWPDRVYRMIGHPVTWLGRLVSFCDAKLNNAEQSDPARRGLGGLTVVFVVNIAALAGATLQWMVLSIFDDFSAALLLGFLAWPMIAGRALYDHVAAVARPLRDGDLSAARAAVAMIVGRDVTQLDEPSVARAAIESLAENASDGVTAPLFWGAVLGLPGLAAYKAINTLDSMIGHRTKRYEAFGWAAAQTDDIANLLPARLTGLLIALSSRRPIASLQTMRRDARKHTSPNAGYPEAAMAGALDVRLSGPRSYSDGETQEPWLNGEARDPKPDDIGRALRIYVGTLLILAMVMSAVVLVIMLSPFAAW